MSNVRQNKGYTEVTLKNVSKMCAEKMENVFKKSDKEQFQDFRKCRPKITQAKITQAM